MFELQPPPRQVAANTARPDGPGDAPQRERGLLLLGHGSDRSNDAARPVRELARELRSRGAFRQVEVGFWKEEPFIRHALGQFEVPEVVVVPIFTSTGHYTEHVIPRELARNDPSRRPAGMQVRLCSPVGTHPGMSGVVMERAEPEAEPGFALVIVGHGTPRHPGSGRVTEELADALRDRWPHGPVIAAFLDQEPGVVEMVGAHPGPGAVVVPFFIAEGWHAGVTLPASLAVEQGEGRVDAKAIRYTAPVGTHPRLAEFVMELAG